MAWEEIPYEMEEAKLPKPVRHFIQEADLRCDAFYTDRLNKRYPLYVPSEPAQVYSALKYISDQNLPLGQTFLEWGSGFGIATGFAALLGYEATGIEIEEFLVAGAEDLLAQQNIVATFICTNYIPAGFIEYENFGTTDIIPDNFANSLDEPPRYEDMDIDISEIDVFFAYPWPGEQAMMLKLFDALAGEGAILATYFGDKDIHLYRKLENSAL